MEKMGEAPGYEAQTTPRWQQRAAGSLWEKLRLKGPLSPENKRQAEASLPAGLYFLLREMWEMSTPDGVVGLPGL